MFSWLSFNDKPALSLMQIFQQCHLHLDWLLSWEGQIRFVAHDHKPKKVISKYTLYWLLGVTDIHQGVIVECSVNCEDNQTTTISTFEWSLIRIITSLSVSPNLQWHTYIFEKSHVLPLYNKYIHRHFPFVRPGMEQFLEKNKNSILYVYYHV